MKPEGVMVHSTGANNPYLRRYLPGDETIGYNTNGNHWNQPMPGGSEVCVHAFIGLDQHDRVQVYQTLPWDVPGWHAGGSANKIYIGFEICEDDLSDPAYFKAVYDAAVELSAYLCRKFDISVGRVICHAEGYTEGIASNHADVLHWWPRFGKNMDDFRADVAAKIAEMEDEDMIRYKQLKDIPNDFGFRDVIEKLMDAGIIQGDGSDPAGNNDIIDLSHDQVRSLVFEYRGGAFDRKLIAMGMEPAVKL